MQLPIRGTEPNCSVITWDKLIDGVTLICFPANPWAKPSKGKFRRMSHGRTLPLPLPVNASLMISMCWWIKIRNTLYLFPSDFLALDYWHQL
jgi:hypothetical protein